MQRRSFLKQAGVGAAAAGAALGAPALAQDMPSLNWRMASGFPQKLDLRFGAGELFCKYVSEATGGKFGIRHYPEGELAPASGLVEAVAARKADCGHGSSLALYGANPAFLFDAAAPFGLDAAQMDAWMYEGDGLRLTRELFKPLKIVNFPLGNTGPQMGGWFRKEIRRESDLKDLKIRAGGLAADIWKRLGAAPVQTPDDELAQAAEKEGLQAVAGAGPYDDGLRGLNNVAKYYYAPAWWAPGEQMSLYINEDAWSKLPKNYQSVVESAARAAHAATTTRYAARNPQALAGLSAGGALVRAYPRSVLDAAFDAAQAAYQEMAAKQPGFKAIHDNYMGFRDAAMPWLRLTQGAYEQYLGVALSGRG